MSRRSNRRPLGSRQTRRIAARRRARRRLMLAVVGVAAIVTAVVRAPDWLPERSAQEPAAAPTAAETATESAPEQDSLLLIGEGQNEGAALSITLLAAGPEPGEGLVVFLPVGTLVDVPGFGVDQLGVAHQYGGAALVEASVENLLGISIDTVATVTNSGLAAFLERTGGLQLEVGRRLVAREGRADAQVRFEPGAQVLDGPRLAEYWRFQGRREQELELFPRRQQVLEGLLAAAAEPEVEEAMFADGAPQLVANAPPDQVRALFAGLAQAEAGGGVTFSLLPVEPFGSNAGGSRTTYRPKDDDLAALTDGPLAASVPTGGGTDAVRIQILNGVGTPGIGQAVDRELEGAGFQVVLTDNARSFDFAETLILVYDESERSLEAARTVQEHLGVGKIQLNRQPQSIVELTIVVGEDFAGDELEPAPTEPEQEQQT